ncbi:GNAT family N-acetyltransferase [Streptomyces sp. NPDC058220]|uniref:GNAT family N-acetyltransferase n=1 Tax=unclassified Streptomyces TaxID=2593676 RepID=UPI00364D0C1C
MEMTNDSGLRIAHVDTDEALGRDWPAYRQDADVIRVRDPEAADRPLLRKAGFAVKPSWLTWLAPVRASEEDFLGRLGRRARKNARHSLRTLRDRGVRVGVHPLDAPALDAFLVVYDAHMSRLRNGVPYAVGMREQFLEQADGYFLVRATDAEGVLIGGCVCALDTADSVVRIRFSAMAAEERNGQLVRAMYLMACQEARERGHRWLSLGSDPSLYGHVAQPGLFVFKSQFGCVPVPSQLLDPEDGSDEADLVVSLRALTDPSLVVAYDTERPTDPTKGESWMSAPPEDTAVLPVPLRMEILSAAGVPDPSLYTAGFLSRVDSRVIAP